VREPQDLVLRRVIHSTLCESSNISLLLSGDIHNSFHFSLWQLHSHIMYLVCTLIVLVLFSIFTKIVHWISWRREK